MSVIAALVVLASVATPSVAQEAWHPTRGAETLPVGHPAVEFRVGYPGVTLAWDIPVKPFMEVVPYIGFLWGWYYGFQVQKPLPVEGVLLKFRLWTNGRDAISLSFDTCSEMIYLFKVLAPEFRYSHRWDNPRIAVFAGVKVPWLTTLGFFLVRATGFAGFEYGINDHFSIHAAVESGLFMDPGSDSKDPSNEADFSAQFGFSYLF